LSLAQELKTEAPDCQLVYIGQKGDKFDTFQTSAHDFDFTAFIKAGKLRRYGTLRFNGMLHPDIFWRNLVDLWRLPGSVLVSWRLLRRFKPDVVFSKGGYVALPVGIAAHIRGIPIVTHDSDTVGGLANRILGRWAAVQATGMPTEFYSQPSRKLHYVGVPIDPVIKKVTPHWQTQIKQQLKLPAGSNVLLVSGGSSGSTQLNELTAAIAPELLQTNLSLHIIHLTGAAHLQAVQAAYSVLPAAESQRVQVLGYSDEFYKLIAAADLIITRAGATTIAELAAAGKACIIVPSAHLSGGHQLKNAQALADIDAAAVAPADAQPDELMGLVNGLLSNDRRRFELARNLHATARTDAASQLAALILKTAAKNQK
jgi:UDP-N-acetylglucosamine--N-acetylmuramyl-(pentapeptide) pyrophosphoryl-undecaprenol N-acetylglucosamine transferase